MILNIQAKDHVIDSQGSDGVRFWSCVDKASIVQVDLNGAKKLVHINI